MQQTFSNIDISVDLISSLIFPILLTTIICQYLSSMIKIVFLSFRIVNFLCGIICYSSFRHISHNENVETCLDFQYNLNLLQLILRTLYLNDIADNSFLPLSHSQRNMILLPKPTYCPSDITSLLKLFMFGSWPFFRPSLKTITHSSFIQFRLPLTIIFCFISFSNYIYL